MLGTITFLVMEDTPYWTAHHTQYIDYINMRAMVRVSPDTRIQYDLHTYLVDKSIKTSFINRLHQLGIAGEVLDISEELASDSQVLDWHYLKAELSTNCRRRIQERIEQYRRSPKKRRLPRPMKRGTHLLI